MNIVKISMLVFLLCVHSFASADETDIYSILSDVSLLKDSWDVERVDYGLHFSSKEKTKNSKGQIISSITLDIEGPNSTPENITIEDAVNSNVENILRSFPINQDFKPSHPLGNGIGASIVDVNGQKVGFIEYEVQADRLIYARHCILLKEQRLYTFTMVFFDPEIDRKKGMALEVLVIAAVNSGKL